MFNPVVVRRWINPDGKPAAVRVRPGVAGRLVAALAAGERRWSRTSTCCERSHL